MPADLEPVSVETPFGEATAYFSMVANVSHEQPGGHHNSFQAGGMPYCGADIEFSFSGFSSRPGGPPSPGLKVQTSDGTFECFGRVRVGRRNEDDQPDYRGERTSAWADLMEIQPKPVRATQRRIEAMLIASFEPLARTLLEDREEAMRESVRERIAEDINRHQRLIESYRAAAERHGTSIAVLERLQASLDDEADLSPKP